MVIRVDNQINVSAFCGGLFNPELDNIAFSGTQAVFWFIVDGIHPAVIAASTIGILYLGDGRIFSDSLPIWGTPATYTGIKFHTALDGHGIIRNFYLETVDHISRLGEGAGCILHPDPQGMGTGSPDGTIHFILHKHPGFRDIGNGGWIALGNFNQVGFFRKGFDKRIAPATGFIQSGCLEGDFSAQTFLPGLASTVIIPNSVRNFHWCFGTGNVFSQIPTGCHSQIRRHRAGIKERIRQGDRDSIGLVFGNGSGIG